MKKNSPLAIFLTLAVVGATIYFLIPTFTFYSKTPEQREIYLRETPRQEKKPEMGLIFRVVCVGA
jgi:hypothetical protein